MNLIKKVKLFFSLMKMVKVLKGVKEMKLSKKMVIAILIPIIDVLVAVSVIPVELKPLLIQLITGLAAVYVTGQAVIDTTKEAKKRDS